MTTILWIIATPFILFFAFYLFCVGSSLLLAVIVRVLQFTWPLILIGGVLWLITAIPYSSHNPSDILPVGIALLILILLLVDRFVTFPKISFRKPNPGTDLDTMQARVLRTIRARYPLMCLSSTYGDLENQPCFSRNGYEKIVEQAYAKVRGDCQEKFLESITLATALRTIDGILEYETQRVRPIVKEYQEAAGGKAVNVIDIRG